MREEGGREVRDFGEEGNEMKEACAEGGSEGRRGGR